MIFLVLAGGFLVRVLTARGTWLNPDEALNFFIANQPGLFQVYRASLTNPHPPLYFFALYFWRLVSSSELFLRLLSAIVSTTGVYFFYRWLSLHRDFVVGLTGAVLLAFLPPLVGLGAEVRSYSFLLLFIPLALYFLEAGLVRRKPVMLFLAGLASLLAGMSQYSVVWFSLAAAGYLLVRLVVAGGSRKLWVYGLLGQALVGAGYLFCYFTHLVKIKGTAMTEFAVTGWLRAQYFQPGEENPLMFGLRNTAGFFQYLFGSPGLGIIGMALFIFGVALVFRRAQHRALGLLLILPFLFAYGGALGRIFPYGGTRHAVFLAPFVCAGISAIGLVIPAKLGGRLVLVVAGVTVLASNLFLVVRGQHIPRADAQRKFMDRAILTLKDNVAPGDTIFTDYQGSTLLSYYLNRGAKWVQFFGESRAEFWTFNYGGYRVVTTQDWDFNQQGFWYWRGRVWEEFQFAPERQLWVFDGGWGRPVVPMKDNFGNNLSVFPVELRTVNPEGESLLIAAAEQMSQLRLAQMVILPDAAGKKLGTTKPFSLIQAILIPSDCASPAVFAALSGIAPRVLTYDAIYRRARRDPKEFDTILPALALWLFGTDEPHPEFMSYMADAQHYIAGNYRFMMLLNDPDLRVAVYRIEKVE